MVFEWVFGAPVGRFNNPGAAGQNPRDMKTELNQFAKPARRGETQPSRVPGSRPCRVGGPCLPSQTCRGCPKSKPASNPDLIELVVAPENAVAIAADLLGVTRGHRFILDRDAREIQTLVRKILAAHLPVETLERIQAFGTGTAEPVLVLRGLPQQESIPPSPYRGFGDDSKTAVADLLLLGVYAVAGIEPVSFAFENNGFLFRNVTPVIGAAGEKSSQGYDVELGWHTDNPCGPFELAIGETMARLAKARSAIPTFLGFTGLRNADAEGRPIPTRILPMRRVVQRLEPWVNAGLRLNEFQVNPPASNATSPLVGVPLLEQGHGGDLLRFNGDPKQVFGLTPLAKESLEALKAMAAKSEDDVLSLAVGLGTVMAFDNRRVAHMRSAFNPGTDLAQARWMRRCYGYFDASSGRFVDPGHWPNLRK